MVSALDSGSSGSGSSPGRGTVLCCWARRLTLAVPLYTLVYKWVSANLLLEVTLQWTSIPSREGGGGVEILLVASHHRNRDKLWWHWWATWLLCRLYLFIPSTKIFIQVQNINVIPSTKIFTPVQYFVPSAEMNIFLCWDEYFCIAIVGHPSSSFVSREISVQRSSLVEEKSSDNSDFSLIQQDHCLVS